MKIKNVQIYGLEQSIMRSGYPMQVGEPKDLVDNFGETETPVYSDYNRAKRLSKVPIGSGHDNFLKGIIVQFDLKYTQYWTKHLQRYGWFTYFSGQSQMHKMAVRPLKEACNKYVLPHIIEDVQKLIDKYNKNIYPVMIHKTSKYEEIWVDNKQKMFQTIMSNCPMGYELWQPITTNYMSLKTMYKQRRNHKLEEWQEFCDWVETLPMSELITKL